MASVRRPLLPADVCGRLLTPALVVWMEAVRHNVRRVLEATGGPRRWRPHLKTTKMATVWRELIRHGVRAFKVATHKELQLLLDVLREQQQQQKQQQQQQQQQEEEGWDVLVAYPVRGPHLVLVGRAASACGGEVAVSVLVESAEDAAALPADVGGFVDVNPGMNRTGMAVDDARGVGAVVEALAQRGKYRGIHFYEGHLVDVDGAARAEGCRAAYARLVDLHGLLEAVAHCAEVVTSGTPGFLAALAADLPARFLGGATLHRVSPGTVIFHDGDGEAQNPGLGLRPACMLVARLVSRPDDATVTLDCGSKSLDAASGDPAATVHCVEQHEDEDEDDDGVGGGGWTRLDNAGDLFAAKHPSEEHLPMRIVQAAAGGVRARERTQALRPGAALFYLVPKHVCPTVNLAEEALVVDVDGRVTVEPVAARAHGPVLLPDRP